MSSILLCLSKTFTVYSVFDWVMSGLSGIILTILFYPYFEDEFQKIVVWALNFLSISSNYKISGTWTHTWYVESNNFPRENISQEVKVKQFRRRILAIYTVRDKQQNQYTYQMSGTIHKEQMIIGKWKDIKSGHRYYGCFQLYIDVNENTMHGFWIGLSNDNHIKSNKWEWKRVIKQ